MGADILNIFKQHIRQRFDITVYTDIKANSWLSIDSYIMVQALAFLVGRLQKRGIYTVWLPAPTKVGMKRSSPSPGRKMRLRARKLSIGPKHH